jgi:murein DD-endopeptidase MepM/ murein hydrolase activator NlpD
MPFLFLILISGFFGGLEDTSVELYQVKKAQYIEVHGRNHNDYPVTVNIEMNLNNLASDHTLPYTVVLKANSDDLVLILDIVDPTKKWEYDTNYSYHMGDIFARHDDSYIYRLPYRLGESAKVVQGYNGSFSHKDDIRYSIDFDLPERTPIYAARGGIVVEVEEGFSEGGTSKELLAKANNVTILHSDGTFADYSHLIKNGAHVILGQKVRAGQLIGYSGATGYASGPHLHFNVKRATKGGGFITIPVQFKTIDGPKELKQGKSYKAL